MIHRILRASLVGLVLAGPALADNGPAEGEDGRFMFKHVEDGFIRLDTRTGQVAFCGRHSVGWTCETTPDERAALEGEIGRLQGENAAMKKELLTRGLDLPGLSKPAAKPPPRGEHHDPSPASDADLDRVMAFLGKAWHRLVEMMTNLQGRG